MCRIRKQQSWIPGTTIIPAAAVVNLESAAVVGTNLYVLTDEQLWKVTLATEEEDKIQGQAAATKLKTTADIVYYSKPDLLPVSYYSKPPHPGSTIHAVKNTLFAFGGRDKDNQPTPDALRYNPDTDTWESAGYMRSCRYNVAVATINQAENLDVIVIGGSFGSSQYVMKPRMQTETHNKQDKAEEKVISEWVDDTSIVERCAVECS